MGSLLIKVVLVDDHKLVRQGIRSLLECEEDIKVVGEAPDGPQGLGLVAKLQPDVLVADLMMAGMTGIELVRKAAKASPNTRGIILSMYGDEVWVLSALQAGARGYVLKDSSSEDLVQAIRTVVNGERFLSPPLSVEKIAKYTENLHSQPLDKSVS